MTIAGDEDRKNKLQNLIGEQLVGCGFNEILNNSLSKLSYYTDLNLNAYTEEHTVKLMNPLSADLGVMRQTMLFGGLESIVRNVNRKSGNLRFFETGNCYHYDKDKWSAENPVKGYTQETHIALWVTGKHIEGSWIHPTEDSTFYELKAYVENIFRRAGVGAGTMVVQKSENNIFSKGLSMMTRGGKALAELGIVDLKIKKAFDLSQDVYFADINFDNVMKAIKKNELVFTEISKYPAVSRDLALLIDNGVEFAEIEQVARQTEKKLLKKVELFDVYQGKNLPEGKKSYAVNFILQDDTKTLNDKAIDAIMQKLIKNLTTKLGAELR